MMARRIAGSEGCGGGPLPSTFFPPPRSLKAAVLEKGEGDAGHQRVPVQAYPGPALEVAEAEFLLQLLMCLLAGPARLDRGGQPPQRGPRRQVAEVVLTLPWHFRRVLRKSPVAVWATIRNRRRSEQLGDDGAADRRQRGLRRWPVAVHLFSPAP